MKSVNLTPRFWVAFVLVVFVVLVGVLGPFLVRTDPNAVIGGLYDKPHGFGKMLLGTDNEGQSVIANLVHGTRSSLIVGLLAGTIATGVGLVIGIIAGYRGGWLDDVLMGFTNVALAIPSIVVVILLSIAFDSRSIVTLALVIGVTGWPWTARAVRAQATSVRSREHLDVAKLSGARFFSILLWDVLPYLLSYVVMAFVLQMAGAIITESALSMLGLGPANAVSLGIMLYWALAWGSIRTGAWWAFLPPTMMLTLIAFSLLLLQSSLDEVFNPRLRRGKAAKRKGPLPRAPQPTAVPLAASGPQSGGAGAVETPVSVSAGERR
jgi:peptide/nickel transport system permease protein